MDNIKIKAHFFPDWIKGVQSAAAGRLSLMLLIFAFIVLFVVYWFNRGFEMVKP